MANKRQPKGPKAVAVQDIKEELHKQGKCFITFRVELNYPIRAIVREYSREQKKRR